MMRKFLIVLGITIATSLTIFAQESDSVVIAQPDSFTITFPFPEEDLKQLQAYEDSIDKLTLALLGAENDTIRFASCKFIIKKLVRALKIKNAFHYPFPKLQRISIQYPEDSAFRIFTWQLYVDKDDHRYYGAIQMKGEDLKLIPLIDRSHSTPSPQKALLANTNWFGAIYYNIKMVETKTDKYYLLFGYDANTFFVKRKLIDVLRIKAGKATFGAPIFKIPQDILEEKKKLKRYNSRYAGNRMQKIDERLIPRGKPKTLNRFMITYSAEASIHLRYDEDYQMILFDNLIPISGGERGALHVPDGSYRGFKLQPDGTWLQVEKVFNDFQQNAPFPKPIVRKDSIGPKGKRGIKAGKDLKKKD